MAALWGGLWEAPAIPLGVVAVLLVVVVGIGILNNAGLHFGGNTLAATSGSKYQGDTAQLGRLPTPQLHPGQERSGVPPQAVQGQQASSNPYYGPARLTWVGTFTTSPGDAPVFRYVEPTSDQLRQFDGGVPM